MKNRIISVDSIKTPIAPCPGFAKKGLAHCKLDILGLCEFGCLYCSSNHGNYLRIRREFFAKEAVLQLGERLLPAENPELTIHWTDILERLEAQLAGKPKSWGTGKTLVFSMLTDGFSPSLVKEGVTEKALMLVLEKTSFRIRVLTKSAVVGKPYWIDLFQKYPNRFVVGLSTGTVDDQWAMNIEIGTSVPSARLRALRKNQDAGIATFGMLCPIFPDMLEGESLEHLVDDIRPQVVETVWAEPYNDRTNWCVVREGYVPNSPGYNWLTHVYGDDNRNAWSKYAIDLYLRLRRKAVAEGWLHKLRFLLYELDITHEDAARLNDLEGILLQSKPDDAGYSQNPSIKAIQKRISEQH